VELPFRSHPESDTRAGVPATLARKGAGADNALVQNVVILAGGSGTRVWPASRRARPKQLLPLGASADESLLAATVRRLLPLIPAERLWVVTAADQAAAVRADVPSLPRENVVAEPAARNTAAAIGLATVHVMAKDPEAVVGVVPADHHIGDEAGYRDVIARALAAAERHDAIVTVGVRPSRPETGFGYLEVGDEIETGVGRVARFVEKPDAATAQGYVTSGRYLWNAGMFFFRGRRMLEAIARHLPETRAALTEMSRGGPAADEAYARVRSISVDFGVMEKEKDVLTVPGDFGWNDVGSWVALADYRTPDGAGNVAAADLVTFEARNNIAFAEPGTLIALLGVDDLVVIRSGNAVLVTRRDRAQDVREIVRLLEKDGRDEYL
jgi:mannose-1-phosphate guanylyltransferase